MKRLPLNLTRAKAFHAGNKTRTWRLMKRQPDGITTGTKEPFVYTRGIDTRKILHSPYLPGEIVYIAEPWHCDNPSAAQDAMSPGIGLYYEATEICPSLFNFKSPALMPEWASRAKVRIISCVPQRVQDVTEREIFKEGIIMPPPYLGINSDGTVIESQNIDKDPWWYWMQVINSIYPGAWEKNLWGWAVEFERIPASQTADEKHKD